MQNKERPAGANADSEQMPIDNSSSPNAAKPHVVCRAFEEFHCQKDYITDTVTVQFRGDFDLEKAISYMLRCYPSFVGREVIEISPNDFYKGMENIGYAVFQ